LICWVLCFNILTMIEYYKKQTLESLFYINDKGLICYEDWLDIPFYENLYKISTIGRVRSLERFQKNHSKLQRVPEKILVQCFHSDGYLKVKLSKDGVKVNYKIHHLMGWVFLNHYTNGTTEVVVDHKDNVKTNNFSYNFQLISNINNCNKDRNNNKVGINGVYKSHKNFTCTIWWKNKHRNLGSYETVEEAGAIRQMAFNLIENGESIEHLIKRRENRTVFKPKKIDIKDYDKIKSLYDEGKTLREIGEIYNVTKTPISSILKTHLGMKKLPRRSKK